jgi:hypothetical protein
MDFISPFRNTSENTFSTNVRRSGDIDIYEADRRPCPICGHPTGDCTGVDNITPKIDLPKRLIGKEPMFLVEKDITEDRAITPYTTARVLVHRKGDYISLTKAKELGLQQ